MGDLAQNVIRPLVQKNVPGTVAISPFGPNMRSIIVNVDPQKLLDYNLTPQKVTDALASGNTVIPAGNIYVKDSMPIVSNNATVDNIQKLGSIPLQAWGRTSTSGTWRRSRTTPTSPTATPWSTARNRSTCRSSRRTPGRR